MDNVKAIIFFLIILCSTTSYASTAGTEIANIQSWLNSEGQKYYKPGTGDQWVRNSSPNGDRYIKVESPIDYKASNGRNYPVVVEKTAQIDGTKIGKAVVRLAKVVTPIGLGIEVYQLVCELSQICKKTDADEWEKQGSDFIVLTGSEDLNSCATFTTPISYLQSGSTYTVFLRQGKIAQTPTCAPDPRPEYTYRMACSSSISGCAAGDEIWQKTVAGTAPTPQTAGTPTESDWAAAETQLNDPRFDEPLLVNGQPVPLANLPILGNVPSITISDTETINRDGNGNITGTTRTTTTLTLTDSATETRPGSVTGTETTTKTDYDTQGQPTGTQTSTATPPPPEKPVEPTETQIQFDTVPDDVAVPVVEVPVTFNSTSWGAGFCPQSPTMTTFTGHQLIFDLQPACDTASQLRPFVLIIATIISAFIIIGAKVE